MPESIVFYDIPGVVKGKAWSPNTWKTRYALNVKGIPYKTVWVEYPDIEALCKKIGATPAEKRKDGTPLYTLPIIYDPNTKSVISYSAAIARYLDSTYPHTPRLIPEEVDALITALEDVIWAVFPDWDFVPIVIPAVCAILHPASQLWEGVQKGVHKMAGWLEADGKEKLFFMGDKKGLTYADVILVGFFMWFKKCCGEDSQEWKDMMSWDGGRWARFMAALEKYESVDEGEDVEL
ncbi:hypothetical protein C8T65DRAFT_658659 [Cerioporus squamosus]|nr:hypothetical protein C8T65DRAFT_658659 [Cerioporus squamosus]